MTEHIDYAVPTGGPTPTQTIHRTFGGIWLAALGVLTLASAIVAIVLVLPALSSPSKSASFRMGEDFELYLALHVGGGMVLGQAVVLGLLVLSRQRYRAWPQCRELIGAMIWIASICLFVGVVCVSGYLIHYGLS